MYKKNIYICMYIYRYRYIYIYIVYIDIATAAAAVPTQTNQKQRDAHNTRERKIDRERERGHSNIIAPKKTEQFKRMRYRDSVERQRLLGLWLDAGSPFHHQHAQQSTLQSPVAPRQAMPQANTPANEYIKAKGYRRGMQLTTATERGTSLAQGERSKFSHMEGQPIYTPECKILNTKKVAVGVHVSF